MASENTDFKNLFIMFQSLQNKLELKNVEQYKIFLDQYFENYKKLYKSNRKIAPYFNPIDLFKVKFDEITHSNILSWTFDPYGSHNQGDLYFRKFF